MTNNNNYPVDLPKTYTISYFDEIEWNKDLTPEEIAKSDELAELVYQDNLLHDQHNEQSSYRENKKLCRDEPNITSQVSSLAGQVSNEGSKATEGEIYSYHDVSKS